MSFFIKRINFLWLILFSIYLSGCQTTPPREQPNNTGAILKPSVLHAKHMATIEKIEGFSLKGRIAVITDAKNSSGRLAWEHSAKKDNVDIYSPLGGKVANITKTPEQVTFTDNKKTLTAADAESLTQETLGFSLPLSGLSYWALGKPSNQSIANVMTWDNNGKIKTLVQDGWNIEYNDYADHDVYSLPRKVQLNNNRISIKLIVDNWDEIQVQ
ncbi:MAG: lipoprotein insertase outer membrane protein LolB [Methylophilaceae bacterium]